MRKLFRAALFAAIISCCSATWCLAADLAYSTYLRDGFTPAAMTSDGQGNLFVAGSAVVDPVSRATSAVVAKLNPQASGFVYLEYLDSAASDTITAIAVDGAGDLFVAGTTANPNFPVSGGGLLASAPTGPNDTRAFVTKLSPAGVVLFSVPIGGYPIGSALGMAVTPQGQILLSGIGGAGFTATPGALSVPNTSGQWYLMELDPTASKVAFAATGIGGSSIAFDATGNIFLAGSGGGTNYPTTPGAYQTTFTQGFICFGLCQIGFPGQLQHLTKVDPAASRLIYSTGINDPTGLAGSTVNTGLAVDAAGNAYVTGTLLEGQYPFNVPAPKGGAAGFLTKVNPGGSALVFSVPYGGGGVALDAAGALYTAGNLSTYSPQGFPGLGPPPVFAVPNAFSWIPAPCVPNNLTATGAAYAMKLDPATGNVLDAQWIDGTSPAAVAVAFTGAKLWVTGTSVAADVPFTAGALAPVNLAAGSLPGAFLSAVDFSVPPVNAASGGPAIACVLDAGNLTHAGPVAAYQILSIFGANFLSANLLSANPGSAAGVAAPNGAAPSIADVTVTFDGNPAQMLYVSGSQINVMAPSPPPSHNAVAYPQTTLMQLSVNGVTIQRQLPLTVYNLNLFANVGPTVEANGGNCIAVASPLAFQPVALNPDGTLNSCANPAKYGSLVSMFVDGVGAEQLGLPMPDSVTGIAAQAGACGADVENVARSGLVYRVDIRLPATLLPCAQSYNSGSSVNPLSVTLTYHGAPVGPWIVNANPTPATPVQSQPMQIWAMP